MAGDGTYSGQTGFLHRFRLKPPVLETEGEAPDDETEVGFEPEDDEIDMGFEAEDDEMELGFEVHDDEMELAGSLDVPAEGAGGAGGAAPAGGAAT